MSSRGSPPGSSQGGGAPGPGSPGDSQGRSRSRRGSRSPSQGSQSGGQDPQGTRETLRATAAMEQLTLGVDPAIDPERKKQEEAFEFKKRYANIDLPPEAYGDKLQTPFTRRPGYNTWGKSIKLEVNQYPLSTLGPSAVVYQYDVVLAPEPTKMNFYSMVWKTAAVQKKLHEGRPRSWIHDGRRLAWSMNKLDQTQIIVDMDKEKGQSSRDDGSNTFSLSLRRVTTIKMDLLQAYLSGRVGWDPALLECMNFLDHLLRMGPSDRGLLRIKRNFYDPNEQATELDKMIDAKKGIYAAFTMNGSFKEKNMLGLAVNVDVANTTFWATARVSRMMEYIVRVKDGRTKDVKTGAFHSLFRPVRAKDRHGGFLMKGERNDQFVYHPSEAFRHLRMLHRVDFEVRHHAAGQPPGPPKIHKIAKFEFDPKYAEVGATATQVRFPYEGGEISIRDYFLRKYGVTLDLPTYPCVVTSKKGIFPPEVCFITPNQRYNFKLSPEQTSSMIKVAVTKPPKRRDDILRNVNLLNWQQDRFLKDFGISVSPRMTVTDARLLQNPKIQFGNVSHDPGVSGRWDLRGKHFHAPNRVELDHWACISLSRKVTVPKMNEFTSQFMNIYRQHGGRIKQKPFTKTYNLNSDLQNLIPEIMADVRAASGGLHPQLIMIVAPDRKQDRYELLKKNFDCRYAVLTQVMLDHLFLKGQSQYISNVCMKVNAKLGGATTRIAYQERTKGAFPRPTLMIGVDVSHPPVGATYGASVAAITMSIDRDATRYTAQCQTNGNRVELLSPNVIREHLFKMIGEWVSVMGTLPQHIYYLRDGVAHNQFSQLIESEINELKRHLQPVCNGKMPRFTVVVAQKRHHIRFFPGRGDRVACDKNGNAHPGTLVERDVTHPFHYDFYLSSHSAIQGTARPTHYHVILDEARVPVNELHRLLYQQCYQYVRSTTPVSIHPAIYYAHLAGKRGVMHEDVNVYIKHKSDERMKFEEMITSSKKDPEYFTRDSKVTATSNLLAIGSDNIPDAPKAFFKSTMWFI